MWQILRGLAKRWSDWCGDREMEMAIRRHLSGEGYYGGSAKLRGVKLAAVKRPGWLQIFRFDATARLAPEANAETDSAPPTHSDDSAVYHELYGLVREDQRSGRVDVRVFRSGDQRSELFRRWSDGLLQLRGGQSLGASDSN